MVEQAKHTAVWKRAEGGGYDLQLDGEMAAHVFNGDNGSPVSSPKWVGKTTTAFGGKRVNAWTLRAAKITLEAHARAVLAKADPKLKGDGHG